MPRPKIRDAQGDFRGGLNIAADDEQLEPNEMRRADEAILDEYGAIKKRAGSQLLADSALHASGVQNGYAWLKDDGTQQLMVIANGTLHTAAFGIPTTFTSRAGVMRTTGTPAFAGFRDGSGEVVYMADGDTGTSLNKWNGTAVTTNIASTPAGVTQLAVYNQRLFGCTGVDQKIYWSTLNNGDSLGYAPSGGGEAVIRTFSDQNITGIAAFGSSLLIFHVSGISRFTGLTQDDIAIAAGAQGVTGDVGALGGRSIVTTPQGVYFLSNRGFYVATDSQVAPISLKMDPLIRSLDLTTAQNVIGVHRPALKEVWWYIPNKGIYRYNYALGAWTGPCAAGYLDPATTSLWEAQDAKQQPIVLAGCADGRVKQCDISGVYRDNVPTTGLGGTSFTLAVRCRRFFFGDQLQFKAFKWIYVQAWLKASAQASLVWLSPQGSGQYSFSNPGAALGEWGTGTWGTGTWGSGAAKPERVPVNGYGPHVDVLFTDSGDAQSVLSKIEVEGFDYGRRY